MSLHVQAVSAYSVSTCVTNFLIARIKVMKPIVVSLLNNNSNNKYNPLLSPPTPPPPGPCWYYTCMMYMHVTCLAIDQFVIELESRARCFAALYNIKFYLKHIIKFE